MNNSNNLERTTLIRDVYRSLINSGRSYAAFTEQDHKLFKILIAKEKRHILDPMSGYGLLTGYCVGNSINSYCLEYNMPLYLWQILCHPRNVVGFTTCAQKLLAQESHWPKAEIKAIISDKFFPDEALSILKQLLVVNREVIEERFQFHKRPDELALALLLPFAGRLSCSVRGDNSTHVKSGGICVFRNWEEDYKKYLRAIIYCLSKVVKVTSTDHAVQFGDARSYEFPECEFDGLFTSPPYPNHRDFVSIFAPEQALLALLGDKSNTAQRRKSDDVIGSNFVAGRPIRSPKSSKAQGFIEAISELERNINAQSDDQNYYIPYLQNYFADLENAYSNIRRSLKKGFEGYIIVVNNTHRGLIIPLSDFIIETWQNLDSNAKVINQNELFHVGTKNPRARGTRARHTRYEIKIWD